VPGTLSLCEGPRFAYERRVHEIRQSSGGQNEATARESGGSDRRQQRNWIGFGETIARARREGGHRGRSQKTLDEAVKFRGRDTLAVQADVAKLADVDKLYAEVSQKLGKIDILFVNAAVANFASFADTTEEPSFCMLGGAERQQRSLLLTGRGRVGRRCRIYIEKPGVSRVSRSVAVSVCGIGGGAARCVFLPSG
jgi:NAD(P)-dependent dehydrogenase (short-subunit alcohol dehydrogenase family)